jgi:hypothetical protein
MPGVLHGDWRRWRLFVGCLSEYSDGHVHSSDLLEDYSSMIRIVVLGPKLMEVKGDELVEAQVQAGRGSASLCVPGRHARPACSVRTEVCMATILARSDSIRLVSGAAAAERQAALPSARPRAAAVACGRARLPRPRPRSTSSPHESSDTQLH